MLIKFFRSSFLIQYLLLIIIMAGIWLPGFLLNKELPVEPDTITPLYNLAHYLLNLSPVASPLVAAIVVLVCAFTLNNIVIYHDLIPANNLLPAFLFIMFFGSNPLNLSTYPVLLCLPLFIGLVHIVYTMNDDPEKFMTVFNASLLISILSLFYPSAAILILYIWLILPVYGMVTGRKLLISIIAFSLPYIYFFTYLYWKDSLQLAVNSYITYLSQLFSFNFNTDPWQITIWALFTIIILIPSVYRITISLSMFNINFRRKMAATVWMLVFTSVFIFFSGNITFNTLVFVPASIIVAAYYSGIKKSLIFDLALLLFLILIIAHNYTYLINAKSMPF